VTDWRERRDQHAFWAREYAAAGQCKLAFDSLTNAAYADGQVSAHRRSIPTDRTVGSLSIIPTRDVIFKVCGRARRTS
jgi:hypothetical protein